MAAGKPIIQTYKTGYSVLEKYNCGVTISIQDPKIIAKAILELCEDKQKIANQGTNAKEAAKEFDFNILTRKLINIIENVL